MMDRMEREALDRHITDVPEDVSVRCDMSHDCGELVEYLDEDGFVYCAGHGVQRQQGGWKRCRKLRAHELRRVLSRRQVARY